MYIKNSDVKKRLLESGKTEFLKYGYKQASLRRICQNAGVTTGAIYSCFSGKEDLFSCIIGNTLIELKQMMQESCKEECRNPSATIDNDIEMMKFLWQNKEVILILLDGSEGTSYEDAIAVIESRMAELFDVFFKQCAGKSMDPDLLRIIVNTRMRGMVEILRGGYSLERSLELAKEMSIYSNTGFQKLIKNAINHNS